MVVRGAFVDNVARSRLCATGSVGTDSQSRDDAVVEQIVVENVLSADQESARQAINWEWNFKEEELII